MADEASQAAGPAAYSAFLSSSGVASESLRIRRPVGGAFLLDLREGFDSSIHQISDWLMDVGWLKADFSPANVRFDEEGLTLSVTRRSGGPTPDVGAEFMRRGLYGFGRYEVLMKPARMQGVVSSFFTHTNERLGDPHAEIDFEFVGGTPRSVHTNYFWKGDSAPVDVPLWFDASEDFHLYAFTWSRDEIVWEVDGVEVRRVSRATARVPPPVAPGRVIANIWAANNQTVEWVGLPTDEGASAVYLCMSHVPAGESAGKCSDRFILQAD